MPVRFKIIKLDLEHLRKSEEKHSRDQLTSPVTYSTLSKPSEIMKIIILVLPRREGSFQVMVISQTLSRIAVVGSKVFVTKIWSNYFLPVDYYLFHFAIPD